MDLVAGALEDYPYCHSLEVLGPRVGGAFCQEAHHPCATVQVAGVGQEYSTFLVHDLEEVLGNQAALVYVDLEGVPSYHQLSF